MYAAVPGGVLRSSNGGESWQAASLPLPPPIVSSLIASPSIAQDDTVIAGTLEDGIFRSEDRGETWSAANFGLLDLNVLSLVLSPAFGEDRTSFAGTSSGVVQSTNGGQSWRDSGAFADAPVVTSLAISPNFATDTTLFAGTEENGLWRSSDAGSTWTAIADDRATGTVNQIIVAQGPNETQRIIVLGGMGLLLSQDGGQHWTDWNQEFKPEEGMVAALAPNGLHPDAPLLVGKPGCRVVPVEATTANQA